MGIKLDRLTSLHVRNLYREELGSGLSPRMVQPVHTTLHKALEQAVADELIPRNVTDVAKAPRPVVKEMQPLSPDHRRRHSSKRPEVRSWKPCTCWRLPRA